MRDARNLFEKMKIKYPEEYEYILELSKRNDLFVGIRKNYINIYYLGASIAKMNIYRGELIVKIHKKYLGEDESSYKKVDFNDFKQNLNSILVEIENLSGKETKKNKNEKICQQWIINSNNIKEDSDWYYIDMEYTMEKIPSGRFDMIAVSRKQYNGKHKVALVELKVRAGSYGGMDGTKKAKYEKEYPDCYEDILEHKNSLFKDDYTKVKFGSGIVGHIADYLRFLQKDYYRKSLKEEIYAMIESHKKLGLINKDNPLYNITSKVQLADKPLIVISSYTKAPESAIDKDKACTIKLLKKTMFKYLYEEKEGEDKSSLYCLERMINKDNINGFLVIRDCFEKSEDIIECKQVIGDEEYDFRFVFVDAMGDNRLNCI